MMDNDRSEIRVVNRKELAGILSCALTTVDAIIARYPDLPIIQRGAYGKEWQFDADLVVAFIAGKRDEAERLNEERSETFAQLALPIGVKDSDGNEISYKEAMLAADYRAKIRKEQQELGFLVPTVEVRDALAKAFRALNANLDSAIRRVGRNHNLPDPILRAVEAEFANARLAFVRDAGKFLQDETPDDDEFSLRA
jgi:phage terminase Nu1 subunit (DNA packaging protein)